MIFLIRFNMDETIPTEAMPKFSPHNFGPFSPRVFSDLEFLAKMGFVGVRYISDETKLPEETLELEYWNADSASEMAESGEVREEEFFLTKLGRGFVEENQAGMLSKEQWESLGEFKARCTQADLRKLLEYVYTKYPEMMEAE